MNIRTLLKSLILCVIHICLYQEITAQTSITVNLENTIRPVTHCASGSLYGITETLPTDITNIVAPLKPKVFANPAISGTGHQQPIGDALKVSERLVNTTAKVQVRLADILPGWPYQWPGQSSWLSQCTAIINNKKASGRTNYDGYEIWNEPYGTWNSENGDYHADLWKPTYDLIRSLDPDERIIGPSFAYYNSTRMRDFLTYGKNNNCLPDVVCWHQWGSGGFVGALENYRALEASLGISPIPISINEYSSQTSDPYEGCPGYSVPFIAKFERHGIESACISWWHTAYPGRLGSLLTPSNEKGGGWYLYKWYGDMSGQMVDITPPNDKSDGIDGFGCIDTEQNYASICIGGNTTGTVNVDISGIPASFGSNVTVTVEYVPWVNKDTPVSGTTTISSNEYTTSNNSISIPVNIESILYAYRIYISPAEPIGMPEIEITNPQDGAQFVLPDPINITATATDSDGTIEHVDFYLNNEMTPFQEEWTAPYEFNWDVPQAGTYQLKAIAYDNEGNSAEDIISIQVTIPQAPYEDTPQTIPGKIEFEHFDVGGNGFAYNDVDAGTNVDPAPDFRTNEDVDIENCTDDGGGYNIGYAMTGEWLEYTVNVETADTYDITFRVACEGDGRTFSLSTDGSIIADAVAVPNTGGWQVWTDITISNVELSTGEQVLRITIGDVDYVNLNYMSFTQNTEQNIIQLKTGWNLIGYPFSESKTIETALQSIWTEVETIKDFEGFYMKSNQEELNSLTELSWGKGYFIHVSADCELIIN